MSVNIDKLRESKKATALSAVSLSLDNNGTPSLTEEILIPYQDTESMLKAINLALANLGVDQNELESVSWGGSNRNMYLKFGYNDKKSSIYIRLYFYEFSDEESRKAVNLIRNIGS